MPLRRYKPSPRPFPERLAPLEYDSADIVRKVDVNGRLSWHARSFPVGKALQGQAVAIRPTVDDGRYTVFLGHHAVATIDLTKTT